MKNKAHIFLIFALLSSISYTAPRHKRKPSSENSGSAALKRSIESALSRATHLDYGILVESLSQGDVIYEKNGNKKLIPASVNKIFTAYTALKKLKPNAVFKTTLHASGPIREGKLLGDLHIKGGGDPSLVSERLWMLVNELRRAGVRTITGNLVADASYYDAEKNPTSRPKYLKDQAYNAPIGALSFNFNTTTIFVRPGDKEGDPPIVFTDPENSYVDVVNHAKTVGKRQTNTIQVSRTEYVKGDIGDTVLLKGNIPLGAKEFHFYRNIVNPALYTANIFKSFMEQRGIQLSGNVLEGNVPDNTKLILEFDSLPLWQIVWGMNKFSNNFVADQVLKKVGAEVVGAPGSLEKGISVMEAALEEIGISKGSYHIEDGSGLTRKTKVTPKHIVTLLRRAYYDFSISAEFVASLVIAGEDGTLKRRFPSSKDHKVSLRAKTGTLDGVSALAGYTETSDGEPLVFAIMLNDPSAKYGPMAGWVDQIALAISRFKRSPKNED